MHVAAVRLADLRAQAFDQFGHDHAVARRAQRQARGIDPRTLQPSTMAAPASAGIKPASASAPASAVSKASIASISASAENSAAISASPERPEKKGWSKGETLTGQISKKTVSFSPWRWMSNL